MFRPDLYRSDDPELLAEVGRRPSARGLGDAVTRAIGPSPEVARAAAWSIVHGFASLWLNGLLQDELGDDPEAAARAAASLLFRER